MRDRTSFCTGGGERSAARDPGALRAKSAGGGTAGPGLRLGDTYENSALQDPNSTNVQEALPMAAEGSDA